MSASAETEGDPPQVKGGKGRVIITLFLTLAAAGAGVYSGWSGLVHRLLPGFAARHADPAAVVDISYLPLDPIVISLAPGGASKHLKFTGQLEVETGFSAEVLAVMPRILDVLNSYLRAVDIALLEDPGAMMRLRAQMLRRVQIVTGEGRVRDLLVLEFILN